MLPMMRYGLQAGFLLNIPESQGKLLVMAEAGTLLTGTQSFSSCTAISYAVMPSRSCCSQCPCRNTSSGCASAILTFQHEQCHQSAVNFVCDQQHPRRVWCCLIKQRMPRLFCKFGLLGGVSVEKCPSLRMLCILLLTSSGHKIWCLR